ncbi:MAG: methylmalonyl-CoA epimerase [Phototrophicales bacterium]|nr:MAG: methylmalonyl-CoA epimerase [Phototrophicales bacterium]RMG89896.1 MAG: methylmalonyl-CoA epimerase [Chloroflexota bacterium]
MRINHLAVVVDDLDSALGFWRDGLGLPLGGRENVPAEAVEVAFLELENAHIELVRPTDEESGVAKYLAKRGAGMHHVCIEVDDIHAKLKQLASAGIELINETPRERDGRLYAFVHPKSTGGVLVELYQLPVE